MVTVAIIDDDRDFTELVAEAIDLEGWKAYKHHLAGDAFHLLREVRPDVILLDVRMESSESGWKLLEMLRLDPITFEIPVVVCSADRRGMDTHSVWLTADKTLRLDKPFDLDELYRVLKLAIPLSPCRGSTGIDAIGAA